jgi:hypothetical protein
MIIEINLTDMFGIQGDSDLREIDKILLFRNDISPFLVHLTRDTDKFAKSNLESILDSQSLIYGPVPFSDARYGLDLSFLTPAVKLNFFSAISFTETPLPEIHNLLDIARRQTDLKPYGLVFIKSKLKSKGVSPVVYINNMNGDKDHVVRALCSLIHSDSQAAMQILPLIAIFGRYLKPVGGTYHEGDVDFTWEREWRFVSGDHKFKFDREDVFVGLCPHDEISFFESKFDWLSFIDPMRNVKWYAEKLVRARKESQLEYSVV